MATKFQMQALGENGILYCWLSLVPDWNSTGYPGPGTSSDVAVSCAPFGTSAMSSIAPTGIASAEAFGVLSVTLAGGGSVAAQGAIGEYAIGVR